jgi:2-phosphoglycerate kinase
MSERRYLPPIPLGGAEGLPWSKGLMARALTATGLAPTRSYELARLVDADLAKRAATTLDLDRLGELAVELLGETEGSRTMRRLRRLSALSELDQPIVLLVGGATGTGKSTLATEVAHRLGITRVTSTDFIRQTMRAFFSKEFMPSVHYSSFDAQLALTKAEEVTRPCSASSTRPATCSWVSTRRSTAPSARAGRWCSKASTSSRA